MFYKLGEQGLGHTRAGIEYRPTVFVARDQKTERYNNYTAINWKNVPLLKYQ